MVRFALRPLLFVVPVLLLITVVFIAPIRPSFATTASITLSLTYGPPTSSVTVKGKGFKASETVGVAFDATPLWSTKASSTGTFSATVTVPDLAQPGNHVVQAKGKSSGYSAQATFLVQAD